MSVLIAAECLSCKRKYPEFWVERDLTGKPTLEGMICENCGVRHQLRRDWSDTQISSPLIEGDGEIKRFEYSYRDNEGKLHNKKMDASAVTRHYKQNYKDKIT